MGPYGPSRAAGDVDPNVRGCGESGPVVLLRLEEDDVELGAEKEDQSDDGGQGDAEAQGDRFGLAPAEVDGHESDPNDARRVPLEDERLVAGHKSPHRLLCLHGKTDEFGLVKVFREVSGLDGVDGAHADEEKVET